MAGASDPDIIMTIDCLFVPRWLGVLCNNNIGLGLTFSNYWTVTVQKIFCNCSTEFSDTDYIQLS